GLARVDRAAVFRRQATQVQDLNLEIALALEHLVRDHGEPPGFRGFSGTGVLAARGSIDQQDARRSRRIFLSLLGIRDALTGGAPFDRQLVVGIGKTGAGALRAGSLARVVIGVPGHAGQAFYVRLQRVEGRIVEALTETTLQLILAQRNIRHFPADVRHRKSLVELLPNGGPDTNAGEAYI